MSPRRNAALGLSMLGVIALFAGASTEMTPLSSLLLVVFPGIGIWVGRAKELTFPWWLVAGLPPVGAALVLAGLASVDFSDSPWPQSTPLTTAGNLTLALALVVAGATIGGAGRRGGVSSLRAELSTNASHVAELPSFWPVLFFTCASLAPIAALYVFFGGDGAGTSTHWVLAPTVVGGLIGFATRFMISASVLTVLAGAGAGLFIAGVADYNDNGGHGPLLVLALFGFLVLVATSVAAGISAGGSLRRARG